MWKHLGVLLTLCGLSAAASISDQTDICNDMRVGDVVPNPYDCQSYFVCAPVPTLSYCDNGLHFDAHRKICNWPERANCKLSGSSIVTMDKTEIVAQTAEPLTSSTTVANTDSSTNTTPNFSESLAAKPRPSYTAVDVTTGHVVDPMDQYDPEHIACRHFGAYFMPHPHSCSKYFLCAYGYLHQHTCGRGTHWNYRRQECELSVLAECYSENPNENEHKGEQAKPSIVCYAPYQIAEGTTSWLPMVDGNQNAQFTSETTLPSTITAANENPTHTPTAVTPRITNAPIDVTPTLTTSGSSSSETVTATPRLPPTSTARADVTILECPRNRQAYLSHSQDCSKYYICIVGMPVLTSCPDGYFWDQKAEFCDLSKNVQCQQTAQ